MNKALKRWIIIAMLTSMAIVISIVESFIPMIIPGVKIGLANVIILIMLYEFKAYEAFLVDLFRIFLVGVLRATLLTPTFLMSLAGGMCSFFIMLIITRFKKISKVFAGILGSLFHVSGQIVMAIILIERVEIIYYLPLIGILSIATGILSGLAASLYLRKSITNRFLN